MFSRDDFEIESYGEFFSYLVVLPFVAFVFPFLGAAYTLGFVMEAVGWLDRQEPTH